MFTRLIICYLFNNTSNALRCFHEKFICQKTVPPAVYLQFIAKVQNRIIFNKCAVKPQLISV